MASGTTGRSLLNEKAPLIQSSESRDSSVPLKGANIFAGAGSATILSTIVALIANTVGAGVLTLPFAMAQAGWGLGIGLLFVVMCLANFSFRLLLDVADQTHEYSYMGIAKVAFGPTAAKIIPTLKTTYCVGTCTAYCVLISDFLPKVFAIVAPTTLLLQNRGFILLVVGGGILLPLTSMPSLKNLRYASYFCVLSSFFLAVVVVEQYLEGFMSSDIYVIEPGFSAFTAIPLMAVSFTVHYNAHRFYCELENNTRERIHFCLNASQLITFSLYATVALVGYKTFGDKVYQEVLYGYPEKSVMIVIARVALGLSITFVYPLVAIAIKDDVAGLLGWKGFQWPRSILLSAIIVAATASLAYVAKNIGIVLDYNGSVFGVFIILVLPSSFYLKLNDKGWNMKAKACVFIICLAAVFQIGGVIITTLRLLGIVKTVGLTSS